MQRPLSYYLALAKRWMWLVILGIVVCGSGTYIFTRFETPIYQASAVIVVNVFPSSSNNAQASIAAAPTVAQLVINPEVLQPVLDTHPGMTLQELDAMTTVSAQPNTQLVEIDVKNSDPQLAAQLTNQISQSFVRYSNTQLPGTLQVLPAQVPTVPVKPKPLTDSAIGALSGLGLALALIFLFEWIENRPQSPEEVQQALDAEVLAVIPYISRRKRSKASPIQEANLAEIYRTLCANLNAEHSKQPLKLIMVTSSQVGDGKSKIAANIASFLALTGKRVLLVDADLHRPVQAQQFQLDNQTGLSTVFMGTPAQVNLVLNGQATSIPTMRVLPTGVLPPNPAELLQSAQGSRLFSYFHNEAPFDYIIFDTPPLTVVADTQILVTSMHAIILVADVDKTPRRQLLQTRRILNRMNARVLGVVINKCRWPEYSKRSNSYYYYSSRKVEQSEVDTSLVMHPDSSQQPTMRMPAASSFFDPAKPTDTSSPSFSVDSSSVDSSNSESTRILKRFRQPSNGLVSLEGRDGSHPQIRNGDSL